MKHVILINGCSFSYSSTNPDKRRVYCDYLPGTIYNIASPGSGIQLDATQRFLHRNRDLSLTHFIYQVPDPARQPLDLEDHDDEYFRVGCKSKPDVFLWRTLGDAGTVKQQDKIFENHSKYLDKALDRVHKNVNLIREMYPDIKVIFLRYAYIHPLICEFSKTFYKDILSNYCNKHNIKYINESNFNTTWFHENKLLTYDRVHPNVSGAKLIANKIIEFL